MVAAADASATASVIVAAAPAAAVLLNVLGLQLSVDMFYKLWRMFLGLHLSCTSVAVTVISRELHWEDGRL